MNFFNDRDLALRFRNNAVPSRERFLYLLIFMVLYTIIVSNFVINNTYSNNSNQWDYYIDILALASTIVGAIVCYRTNKSGDDKEFIERYISIGIPISVQLLSAAIPLLIIGAAIELATDIKFFEESSYVYFALYTIFQIYYYWRLNSSIRVAAHP